MIHEGFRVWPALIIIRGFHRRPHQPQHRIWPKTRSLCCPGFRFGKPYFLFAPLVFPDEPIRQISCPWIWSLFAPISKFWLGLTPFPLKTLNKLTKFWRELSRFICRIRPLCNVNYTPGRHHSRWLNMQMNRFTWQLFIFTIILNITPGVKASFPFDLNEIVLDRDPVVARAPTNLESTSWSLST